MIFVDEADRTQLVRLDSLKPGSTFKRTLNRNSAYIYILTDQIHDGHPNAMYCVNLVNGNLITLSRDLKVEDYNAEVHSV